MYAAIIFVLIGIALILILAGLNKKSWLLAVSGVIIAVLTGIFFWFMGFWGEALWFESVGYEGRFWKVVFTKIIAAIGGGIIGFAIVTLLTISLSRKSRLIKMIAQVLAIYIGGEWAAANWDRILLFINRVSTDVSDPILQMNTGFYLFTLPLLNTLYDMLFSLSIISIIACLAGIFLRYQEGQIIVESADDLASRDFKYTPLYFSTGGFLLVLAFGKYLDRYNLMYSSLGVVSGPGWTDANVRLPVYYVIILILIIASLILLIPLLRRMVLKIIPTSLETSPTKPLIPLISVIIITFASWFILLGIVPGVFQWLKVQPSEISLEEPYIKHNIEFTHRGFGLHKIEEKRYPVKDEFTMQSIEENKSLFQNIRLWDWRALDAVYKQFQEIRLYYEFADVDVDRYTFGGNYRQVMVSAREMELGNLPVQSQTFVNKRFKYTHGIGMTLTKVSEFTPEGLPNLLIKNIPPVSEYPELKVEQPRIYYGELTDTHVIVNSKEKELDYPSGEVNVYNRYEGTGGVQISNLWRKFLFGWKFDGTRLFLSEYPRPESRIMFHREITERVKTIAPFLKFDDDPYIVLADGKMYWMLDAYTVSSDYPYSEPTERQARVRMPGEEFFASERKDDLRGINYIRNSVKTVIDAYEGTVTFYVFEEEDPLIRAWSKVFTGMFKSQKEMPDKLLSHIRYPNDLLLVQGLVYSKYHMTDPTVFYNQEDLWVRATENYYGTTQPVQPYYIMWEMPESDKAEFVTMMPFTPKNKQVLIGWIAGMCDPDNYGRLLAYKFPKEKRVLGTQQVETKIDQNSVLSQRLSLWDQRGSRVIRGNVLVIPIAETIIYVEPIYLKAETAAYPELRLVAVMHDDNLSYAETFEEALLGLVKKTKPKLEFEEGLPADQTTRNLINQADRAFEGYLDSLSKKEFGQASKYLENLSKSLKRLKEQESNSDVKQQ